MIHHRLTRNLLLLISLVCAATSVSSGQILPRGIIESSDITPQNRAEIDQFVNQQVQRIAGQDTTAQQRARDALISPVANDRQATPSFFDQYADSLNASLLPLAKNTNVRVRLNAAIVAARVAAKVGNGRLASTALAFVQDKSDAVVLWGIKAADYIVPPLVSSASIDMANRLGKAVVTAAKDHAESPAIIEDAYRTVLLHEMDMTNATPTMIAPFLPQPTALFDYRVSLYADGVPPDPRKDADGAAFFVKEKVWSAQTKSQQSQSLQTMLTLCRGAAKQNAVDPTPELVDVIRLTGNAIEVAANNFLQNAAMGKAAHLLASIGADTSGGEIENRIKGIKDAMKAAGLASPSVPDTGAQAAQTPSTH